MDKTLTDKTTGNHFIMGTAGHVDHGKTALIKALTGFDCDTHPEEKLRGITINLGFTYLNFPDGKSISIIDVPGHIDYINTMISGAFSLDFLLFVVAADSSVMPQTIEHLQIAQLLGVKNGIVVLTKTDLADEEMLMIAEDDVNELLKNTFLENAPVFKVSAKTNAGINELRNFLAGLSVPSEIEQSDMFFRMPIDRIFSVAGFGTVVTGSVLSGSVCKGNALYILPGEIEVNVRRIENHSKEVLEISAGNRAALNITGLKKEEFKKGMTLCSKKITPSKMLDCKVKLIDQGKGIDIWSNAIFLSGTSLTQARIHLIDTDNLKCDETALVQIHLNQSIIAQLSDKFIIRNSSNNLTLGGGEIIDPYPLHHKRRTKKLISQLIKISNGSVVELIAAEVRKHQLTMLLDSIADLLNLEKKQLKLLKPHNLPEDVCLFQLEGRTYLAPSDQIVRLKNRVVKNIGNYHKQNPLDDGGRTFEELMSVFGVNRDDTQEAVLKFLLKKLVEDNILKKNGFTFTLYAHNIMLNDEDKKQLNFVEAFHKKCELNTPLSSELIPAAFKFGISENKLYQILSLLTKQNKLYNIDGNYIYKSIIDSCRKSLIDYLSNHGEGITVAGFRDLINGNRKICLLLFAQFDKEGIIRREGDLRFITVKGISLYEEYHNRKLIKQ